MHDSREEEWKVAGSRPAPKVTVHASAQTAGEEIPERKPPKIRVVAEERLTPSELKQRFAENLVRLVRILGLSLKDAAQEVGIAYKLMRRLASAGVSRTDDRNTESLSKLVSHFALPDVGHLWRADLLRRLLTTSDGADFVEKFRGRLDAERRRRLAASEAVGHEDVVLVGRALGLDAPEPQSVPAPYGDMVAAILASPKGEQFKRLIEDYHELAMRDRDSRPVTRQAAGA